MKIAQYLLMLTLLHDVSISNAQNNLILNGGFEDRGKMDCLHCNLLYGKYPALVHYWDNQGWGCTLCDKAYKQNSDELKGPFCPFEQMSPRSGDCMIALEYHGNTNGKHGAASRLCARTTQSLQVGHLFEISFWLYIRRDPKQDPDWAKHIGIVLSPQKISLNSFVREVQNVPTLKIDTVIYDQWYQVKWRVRPLCNSNFLMIGLFGDDNWPAVLNTPVAFYYVDDVMLVALPSESIKPDSATYYCSQYDPAKNPDLIPQLDNGYLFFESNAYNLTTEQETILDSIAGFARQYPDIVFEISGHTDSIGTDNLTLSDNRVQSVVRYLTTVQQLPAFRIFTRSLGSKSPSNSNDTESGRRWNRSVEIKQTDLGISGMFYRRAIQAVSDHRLDDAFSYLNKWARKAKPTERIILLFDPRFTILRKDKRWHSIEKNIRDGYSAYKYPNYAFQLDSLQTDYRRVMGQLSWEFCRLPSDSITYRIKGLPESQVHQKLKEHFSGLHSICGKIGWPKRAEFGEYVATAAFYILQHSGDTSAYIKWLPVFQKACAHGEASWEHYAMLYDRCNIFMGKPQRYGTQFKVLENGKTEMHPCEGDENLVNQYRKKIGLPIIAGTSGTIPKE